MNASPTPDATTTTTTTTRSAWHWLLFPLRLVRWVLRLVWRIISWPFRTYREHISAQLVASHTLVVILTVLLVELVIIGFVAAVIAWVDHGDVTTDYSLGYDSQVMADTIMISPSRNLLIDPDSATTADIAEMNRLLEDIQRGNRLPFATIERGSQPDGAFVSPTLSLGLIDLVVVFDREGRVVASSDPVTTPTGTSVNALPVDIARGVTARVLELNGQPTAYGNAYVLDASERRTVAASPLRDTNGDVVGVVLLQTPRMLLEGVESWNDVAVIISAGGLFVIVVATIPALLVSLPVGIWRGRRMARRVNALATAAEQVAAGDLTRRVAERGSDEISALGRDFNRMAARLDESDRSRRAFVANVSHELRTPVAIIQGNLERLLHAQHEHDGTLDPPAAPSTQVHAQEQAHAEVPDDALAHTLQMLHNETQTLSRLIDDLFTIARIEEAQLVLHLRTLDVRSVVQHAVDGIRDVAWDQRRVTVQSVIQPGLPAIRADETRVRQILGNLLYNALRHTPEGGIVVIDATPLPDVIEISVADTGVGIPAAELERVFERFHQVEREGRHADNSGLGLAIVRQLVEVMGGSISAESTTGVGSVFRVRLPRVG